MKFIFLLISFISISCAHKPEAPVELRVPAQSQPEGIKQDDITIWSLQELARQKKFDQLNELFNNGVTLQSLPNGYAAGAATRVLNAGGPLGKILESITGKSWKGKMFFPSKDPRQSKGLNRIREGLFGNGPVTPMASFTTNLLDHDPLAPKAKSPVINLNYAAPMTSGFWQERALKGIQVYDLMVPVHGKYGLVFIGKTWLGRYDKAGNFTTDYPDHLTAWFFLDFTEEALKIQLSDYWDGSKENILSPLPEVP